MMSGVGKVVCVTGASGYIGSWLVKVLLQSGYIVKATVSNLSDSKKTDHLVALDGAEEKLHLFKANLMEEGSFDTAINGCDGVFHTASPAILSATDPQAEIIEPAVKGTLNVLRSCAKAQSLKRVVITSSFASVLLNGKKLAPDVVVDETWFSDPVLCENLKLYYPLSKILAEEAAWKFAKENQIDLVTIHPALALGPLLPPVINNSVELIMNLVINGPQTFPISVCGFLDVRDVANAHVQAFEVASASGRYNLVGCVAHISDVLKILKDLYPALNIPEKGTTSNAKVSSIRCESKESGNQLHSIGSELERHYRKPLQDSGSVLIKKGGEIAWFDKSPVIRVLVINQDKSLPSKMNTILSLWK